MAETKSKVASALEQIFNTLFSYNDFESKLERLKQKRTQMFAEALKIAEQKKIDQLAQKIQNT